MQIQWEKVWAVVITGLVVVFIALVLLIIFVTLFGKLFSTLEKSKKNNQTILEKPVVPNLTKTIVPESVTVAEDEDDDEIIAVISAAVAMMSAADGKQYAVKSIKRSVNQRRQSGSAWGMAGQRENTRPF